MKPRPLGTSVLALALLGGMAMAQQAPQTATPDAPAAASSKDQQKSLKKQEDASKQQGKSAKAQRKALKEEDKAAKAAEKVKQ